MKATKKATRKDQKIWISEIIEDLANDPGLLNESGDPWKTTADNVRACSRDSRGGNYYGTPQAAAEHFLRGLGLPGFPFADDDQAAQLRAWGFNPTPRMVSNFWTVSAGLLVDVLREHGEEIR